MSRSKLFDFEILSRLGSGSFGTVFKVRRLVDDKYYVIKNVRIVELSYKEQTEAINEVQILAQLKSPFVVRYYDSFIENDSLHIVMEYCNRGDLQNLIKKAKEKNMTCLKNDIIWNLSLQVLLGLYYLHKKNILHRDLKSANVFLMKDDSKQNYLVKIGDLGVAKLMDTSTALANTIVGTPYYLSPELCADKPYRDKSDCWAFGVLLYECCTLSHPFEARNQCALIMKIIEAQVKPPTSPSLSKELIELILWLLKKDPNERPSIKDILNEKVIREKLSEHKFELPEELNNLSTTNRLRLTAKKSENIKGSRYKLITNDSQIEIPGIAYDKDLKLADKVSMKDLDPNSNLSVAGNGMGGRNPSNTNLKKDFQKSRTGSQKSGIVRGDRVRGPINSRRLLSEKALNRYQVKPSNTTSSSTNLLYQAANPSEQKNSASNSFDVEEKMNKSFKSDTKLTGNPQGVTDHELNISEAKNIDIGQDLSYNDDEIESANNDYEEDFEDYSEEQPNKYPIEHNSKSIEPKFDQTNPSHSNNSTKNLTQYNGTYDIKNSNNGSHEDSESGLWNSIWTENRGKIDEDTGPFIDSAKIDEYFNIDASSRERLDSSELDERINDSDFETDLEVLLDSIQESKSRSMSLLGESLFMKIYDLCNQQMKAEDETNSENLDKNEINNKFVEELEKAFDQSNTGLEMACEAVFGVKVLLALESKYDQLSKSNMHTKK